MPESSDRDKSWDETLDRLSESFKKVGAITDELGDVVIHTARDLRDFFSQTLGDDTVSQAIAEKRCIKEPFGCGEALLKEDGTPRFDHFPNRETAELYEREWRITGMCPNCQDRLEMEAEKYESEAARAAEQHDIDGCGNAPCTCQPF